jgi:hypothetical protein
MTRVRHWRGTEFERSAGHPTRVLSADGAHRLIKRRSTGEWVIQRMVGGRAPWMLATTASTDAEAMRAWQDRTGEKLSRLDLPKGRGAK